MYKNHAQPKTEREGIQCQFRTNVCLKHHNMCALEVPICGVPSGSAAFSEGDTFLKHHNKCVATLDIPPQRLDLNQLGACCSEPDK